MYIVNSTHPLYFGKVEWKGPFEVWIEEDWRDGLGASNYIFQWKHGQWVFVRDELEWAI